MLMLLRRVGLDAGAKNGLHLRVEIGMRRPAEELADLLLRVARIGDLVVVKPCWLARAGKAHRRITAPQTERTHSTQGSH
jgi:hypothetical protein